MTDTIREWNHLKAINEALREDSRKLIEKAREQLALRGVAVGTQMVNNEGTYQITKIKCSGYGDTLSFALYGFKFRKDGTWGDWEHYIGDYR